MKVIGLAGWSGAGKTTLIVKLLPLLRARGCSVSTIKHAHHAFDLDQPGKDSFRHREAGASEVLVVSSQRWALLHEVRDAPEPSLAEHLRRLSPCDLVLIEGFKRGPFPKIEVHRVGNAKPFLWPDDATIVALASDAPPLFASVPCANLDDIEAIVALVLAHAMPVSEAIARGSVPN